MGDCSTMFVFLGNMAVAAPADLPKQWSRVESLVRAHTDVPIPLSDEDLIAIVAGEAVTARFDTDQGAFATGGYWIEAPIDQVWIAVNDGEHEPGGRTELHVLPSPAENVRRIHLTVKLPFPISNRQWVADIVPNQALYDATDGRVWQRQWSLADRSHATEPGNGMWLKENRGAWTLLDTGDGTLVLFSVRTVLGGLLPTSITQAWAVRNLRNLFGSTETRAKAMPTHYTADHFDIPSPTGHPVAHFPR